MKSIVITNEIGNAKYCSVIILVGIQKADSSITVTKSRYYILQSKKRKQISKIREVACSEKC
jgi:hypothetical protein